MKTRRAKAEPPAPPGKKRLRTELLTLYSACMSNAYCLRDEARLLQEHGHNSRAFFLALTAFEEIGKAQIVADFFSNYVSEGEFQEAFRKHRIKLKYNSRSVSITTKPSYSVELEYEQTDTSSLERARGASLYVEYAKDMTPLLPKEQITAENAEAMLERLDQEINAIQHAEWLNQRVGSAGLFK